MHSLSQLSRPTLLAHSASCVTQCVTGVRAVDKQRESQSSLQQAFQWSRSRLAAGSRPCNHLPRLTCQRTSLGLAYLAEPAAWTLTRQVLLQQPAATRSNRGRDDLTLWSARRLACSLLPSTCQQSPQPTGPASALACSSLAHERFCSVHACTPTASASLRLLICGSPHPSPPLRRFALHRRSTAPTGPPMPVHLSGTITPL